MSCLAIAGVVCLQEGNPFQYLFPSWPESLRLIFYSDDDKRKLHRLKRFEEAIALLKHECSKAGTLKEWQIISEDITYMLIELDKVEVGSDGDNSRSSGNPSGRNTQFIRQRKKKIANELVEMGAAVDFEILS